MEFAPPTIASTPQNHVASISARRKPTRKRVWKQRYLGYVVDRAWYTKQAQERFCSPGEQSCMHHRTRFLFELLIAAGLSGHAMLKNVKLNSRSALCITLASNNSKSTMKLPSQEKIDKLKALLGTDEPAKWYEYDG
jgi:hypothetical protein